MLAPENSDWTTSGYAVPINIVLGKGFVAILFGSLFTAALLLEGLSTGGRVFMGAMPSALALYGLWQLWIGLGVITTNRDSISMKRPGQELTLLWPDVRAVRWDAFGHLVVGDNSGGSFRVSEETDRFDVFYSDVREHANHAVCHRPLPLVCHGNLLYASVLGLSAITGLGLTVFEPRAESTASPLLQYAPTLLSVAAVGTLAYAVVTWMRRTEFHPDRVIVHGLISVKEYSASEIESLWYGVEATGSTCVLRFKDGPELRFQREDWDVAPAEIFEAVLENYANPNIPLDGLFYWQGPDLG